MLRIAFSPIYKYELPDNHRFPMQKYELLPQQLLYEGTIEESNFFHPQRLTDEEILLTHTKEYLNQLQSLNLSRKQARAIGFPIRADLIERGRHIAHGTYECAEFALEHGVSMNIAGGTHHAYADHGEGFCVFNDFAIAANMLLNRNNDINKILIVDLDVHQGNGTAKIFAGNDRVFTFSMHGDRNYPLRKEVSDLDIPLPDDTGDEFYLTQLEYHLPKMISSFQPDFVFYLSGVDILKSDKLGRLSVSINGCKMRDQFVLETCKKLGLPVAISMGGGYSERLATIIEAHANTFRLAKEIYF